MKLNRTDHRTIQHALRLAIDYEESVIDAHIDYLNDRPMRGYAEVVRRCERNIKRFQKLLDKMGAMP